MAWPADQFSQQGHACAAERDEAAVHHDGVPADVHHVTRHGQRLAAAARKLLDDLPDQGAQPAAAGLDHRDAVLLERAGGYGADAGGHDRFAQRGAHRVAGALLVGGMQEACRCWCAGERHRVESGGADGLDKAAQRRGILRRHPAVDGYLDHLGASEPQCLHDVGQRLTVQLDRDRFPCQVAGGHQVRQDLAGGLRVR